MLTSCVTVCSAGEWTCFNRHCLSSRQRLCDGVDDCSDGSDESYAHARCPGVLVALTHCGLAVHSVGLACPRTVTEVEFSTDRFSLPSLQQTF